MRVNLPVDDIIVGGLRARLEAIGDRNRVMLWSGFVVALVGAFAIYPRLTAPDPVIAAPASSGAQAVSPAAELFVHVAGAVAEPGLYRFPEGLRVADAIEAAGGPLRRADLDAINLADELRDGLKIDVPVRGQMPAVPVAASPSAATIDLNTADQAALETVPGIGPVTATAILQHRIEIGTFESVEQLLDVSGIGPATLEALRPYVTV